MRLNEEVPPPYRATFVAIGDTCGYQSSALTAAVLLPPECRHGRRRVRAHHWPGSSVFTITIDCECTHGHVERDTVLHTNQAQCDPGGVWRMWSAGGSRYRGGMFLFLPSSRAGLTLFGQMVTEDKASASSVVNLHGLRGEGSSSLDGYVVSAHLMHEHNHQTQCLRRSCCT